MTPNMQEIYKDEKSHPTAKKLTTYKGYVKYRVKVIFICIHLLFSLFPFFLFTILTTKKIGSTTNTHFVPGYVKHESSRNPALDNKLFKIKSNIKGT